ncbi:MAG: glycosyltransferase family 4 protein [Euryarchaeota archaeon]|nr:glycosyltransferase family 4 protein [Euryarchaeota archaeon]
MKIFFIDIIRPPYTSYGIEGSMVHKWELINNLAKYGNEIHALSYENIHIQYDNICLHAIPKSKRFIRLTYLTFLLKMMRKYSFDIVYIRTDAGIYASLGYIVTKIFTNRVVYEVNGITFEEQQLVRNELSGRKLKTSENIKIKFRKYKEILMWKRADSIIAVTSYIKKYLIQYQIDEYKINVIENGANTELFKPIDKCVAREQVGLDQKYRYICFVGNLAPWQGLEFLIAAAPLILKEYINTRFLVVGDGVMKEKWMQLAEDLGVLNECIFTGSVPYEIVPTYINAADVCVVPKKPIKSGYSPLKLYEYMACGKPIIATRTDGFELLEEINAGILVNPENPVEFANSTLMLLNNSELMWNMGNSGRKYVIENHSWDGIAKKVMAVCNNLIKNR